MLALKIVSASSYSLRDGVRLPMHQHDLAQVEVVMEGAFVLVQKEGEQVLQPGSWVWLAPGVSHGWRSPSLVRCLTFKCAMTRSPPRCARLLVTHPSAADSWLTSFPERILQFWMTGRMEMQKIAGQFLSTVLWLTMQSKDAGGEGGLNKPWRELIGELRQPATPRLPLVEMARRVHLSPSRFRQKFKEQFMISPVHFQMKQRMEWARDVLQYTTLPLKEIGHQLGYSDLATFSKAFAKQFRKRPSKFRRNFRRTCLIPPDKTLKKKRRG